MNKHNDLGDPNLVFTKKGTVVARRLAILVDVKYCVAFGPAVGQAHHKPLYSEYNATFFRRHFLSRLCRSYSLMSDRITLCGTAIRSSPFPVVHRFWKYLWNKIKTILGLNIVLLDQLTILWQINIEYWTLCFLSSKCVEEGRITTPGST